MSRSVLSPIQPYIQWVPELFARVKWLGHVVDYSFSLSAKFKNEWSYTSTPSVCLHGIERTIVRFLCSVCSFMGMRVFVCLQETRGRGRKGKLASTEDGLSARQKSRIVSKATISTSESDSDSNQLKIASG